MNSTLRRWLPYLVFGAALLTGAYFAAPIFLRSYTNSKIQGTLGVAMPSFDLELVGGGRLSSASLAGRVVVLNFFRSRCHSCEQEKDAVREFARGLDPAKVAMVGILVDRLQGFPESETTATLARAAFAHPVVHADQAFANAFHGVGWTHVTPITYVVDTKGAIVKALRGGQSLAALRAALP